MSSPDTRWRDQDWLYSMKKKKTPIEIPRLLKRSFSFPRKTAVQDKSRGPPLHQDPPGSGKRRGLYTQRRRNRGQKRSWTGLAPEEYNTHSNW